jgi:hypothetical protein
MTDGPDQVHLLDDTRIRAALERVLGEEED